MPDPISNRFKMSQERLDSIKEELRYLETVREKEVADKREILVGDYPLHRCRDFRVIVWPDIVKHAWLSYQ